jgi:hypothetical protein
VWLRRLHVVRLPRLQVVKVSGVALLALFRGKKEKREFMLPCSLPLLLLLLLLR